MGDIRTMKVLRLLRNRLIALAGIILLALLFVGGLWLYLPSAPGGDQGVVYGHAGQG